MTDVVGLFKRYTARRINDVMNRQGRVWVDENFDHWCRKSDKVERVKKYIANNPVKAKLVNKSEDWKWQK